MLIGIPLIKVNLLKSNIYIYIYIFPVAAQCLNQNPGPRIVDKQLIDHD
jgi:hypothetical protein